MSVGPFFCRHCGSANSSPTDSCSHCGQLIIDPRIPGKDLPAKEWKCGITRRTALRGFAGAASMIALGGGMWIWRAYTRRPQLLTYQGHHNAAVNALIWLPDGNSIASGDANGRLFIWDVATETTVLTCQEPSARSISSVSLSPDSTSILVGYTNMLVIWDAQSGKNIFATSHLTGPAAYSPQGDYKPCYMPYEMLIAACQNNNSPTNSVLIFPANSLKSPIASINSGMINNLAFSTDGSQILALASSSDTWKNGGIAIFYPNHNTCSNDDNTPVSTPYYNGNADDNSYPGERSVAWMQGCPFLMGGSATGKVAIIYGEGYQLDNPAEVVAVSWCPTQENLPAGVDPWQWSVVFGYMATADVAGVVRVWGNNGENLVAMRTQQSILCLAWSPDGKFLAAGCADGTVQVWQAHFSGLTPAWQSTSFNG
jgi:WD40 repeat protein